jgi:hypothetical protein
MLPTPKRIISVWNQDCSASAAKLMSLDPNPFPYQSDLASMGERWVSFDVKNSLIEFSVDVGA